MNRLLLTLGATLVVFNTTAHAAADSLSSPQQRLGYAIGMRIGKNIQKDGLEIDADALAQAIKDVMAGKPPQMSEEKRKAVFEQLNQQRMEKRNQKAQTRLEKGRENLAGNKKAEGIVELPSGVQYQVLKAGDGAQPTAENKVVAHYTGTLIDGTVFDSSVQRGEPATFSVGGVIKGWQEVLQLMKTGAKWQVFIPSELAYGQRGTGGDIGPNETLIFEIELLEVK